MIYRNSIILSIVLSICMGIVSLIILYVFNDVSLLNNYLYKSNYLIIIYSICLFYLFVEQMNQSLIICRMDRIEFYMIQNIKRVINSIVIFMAIVTAPQCLMCVVCGEIGLIINIIYYNTSLSVLIALIYVLIFIFNKEILNLRIGIGFIVWCSAYIYCISYPNSLLNLILPIQILNDFNLVELIKLLVVIFIALSKVMIQINHKDKEYEIN